MAFDGPLACCFSPQNRLSQTQPQIPVPGCHGGDLPHLDFDLWQRPSISEGYAGGEELGRTEDLISWSPVTERCITIDNIGVM